MAVEEFGIDNCLVFASGTIALPKISKIIKINLNNESELDWVRSLIYGNERHGIRTENNELFQIYDGTNFSFYNYTEQIVFASQNRDGKPNGTRSSREVEQTRKGSEVVTRKSIDKAYSQAIKWKGITYYDEFNNDVPYGQAAISKRVSDEKNAVGEQQTVSNEYNSGSTERRAMYAGVGLSNQQSRELGLDGIQYDSRSGLDSEGNTLSPQQAEFFKDSKVRDENGNLLVMYHGTNNDFTIFENSRIGSNTNNEGIFGKGFYFTNNKALAKNYNRKNGKMFFA